VKQSLSRRSSRNQSQVLDLTAFDGGRNEAEAALLADRVREFYREHADEIVARMRNPTTPSNNVAAGIVAQCEPNPRLRAEAERAVDAARLAREARRALDSAIASYDRAART
jgi:hypothetical protein